MSAMKWVVCAAMLGSSAVLADGGEAEWGYDGETGPDHWGELAEEYRMCSEGRNQSPVDLNETIDAELPLLEFAYQDGAVVEENTGHTIQANVSPGNMLLVPERGWEYELKQFHFHSPSEHTVDGQSFDMEIHLVHADAEGRLAVVGLLVEEGAEHPVLNQLKSWRPEESDEPVTNVNEAGLLPPTTDYWSYNGSLTTPPCSEGVAWVVLKSTLEASEAQIERFKSRVGEVTNRPVQDNNARIIME